MSEYYYSANELAKKFNVSKSTVIKWIHEKKLKAIKLGDIWRIPESAVQKFIVSNTDTDDKDEGESK